MDQAAIDDIKEFLSTTVRNIVADELAPFKAEFVGLKSEVVDQLAEINQRLDDFALAQNEVLNVIGGRLDRGESRADGHEERIVRLEHRAA